MWGQGEHTSPYRKAPADLSIQAQNLHAVCIFAIRHNV